ncbi:hypothetical protein BGZ47_005406 [Haplosporangium gracile]|nr:hypothetical protein BGZ47_005406 [Haplosporangium gracile]
MNAVSNSNHSDGGTRGNSDSDSDLEEGEQKELNPRARYRRKERPGSQRPRLNFSDITKEDCIAEYKELCLPHLKEQAMKGFESADRKRFRGTDTKASIIQRARTEFENKELIRTKAFPGSMKGLAEKLRSLTGRVEEQLDATHTRRILDPENQGFAVLIYEEMVRMHLDGVWNIMSGDAPQEPADPYNPEDPQDPDEALLKEDLRTAGFRQRPFTDYEDEVSAATLKMAVALCQRMLYEEKSTVDLKRLLPDTFTIDHPYFAQNTSILTELITPTFQVKVERDLGKRWKPDTVTVLTQDFNAYMSCRTVGSYDNIDENTLQALLSLHPLWDSCISMIGSVDDDGTEGQGSSHAPATACTVDVKGLSESCNTFYREHAATIAWIWKGSLYPKLHDRVKYVIKLWVWPTKVTRHKERKLKFAERRLSRIIVVLDVIEDHQNAKPNHQLNDQNGLTSHSGDTFADQDFPSDDDSDSDYDLDSDNDSEANDDTDSDENSDLDDDSNMEDIGTAAHTESDGPNTTGPTEMDSVSTAGQNLTTHTTGYRSAREGTNGSATEVARTLLEDPDVNGDIIWKHVRDELFDANKCSERDHRSVADIVAVFMADNLDDSTSQVCRKSQTDMTKILKVCSGSEEGRLELYEELQDARRTVRDLWFDTLSLEHQVRVSHRYNYFYNGLAKAPNSTTTTNAPSSSPPPSYPTLEHPGTHDFVETMSASGLLSQVEERNSELAVGTDDDCFQDDDGEPMEGVEFEEHGSVMAQDNFAEDNSQAGTKQQLLAKYDSTLPKQQLLNTIKFNKPVKLTAPQIREIIAEVEEAQYIRRQHRGVLRAFEMSPTRIKDRHRLELGQKRAWTIVAASERRQVKTVADSPKLSYKTVPSHPALDINLSELEFAMSASTFQASHYTEPDPFAFGYANWILEDACLTRLESEVPTLEFGMCLHRSSLLVHRHQDTSLLNASHSTSTTSHPIPFSNPPLFDTSFLQAETFIYRHMDYNIPPADLESFLSCVDPTNGARSACGTFHYFAWTGKGLEYPTTCMHHKKRIMPLMFIGTEGVGVGSSIGGSRKYGDQRIIEQHRAACPVLMTGELHLQDLPVLFLARAVC